MLSSWLNRFAKKRPERKVPRGSRSLLGLCLEELEDRSLLTTTTMWTGGGFALTQDARWSDALNWTNGPPQSDWDVIFPAGLDAAHRIPASIVNDVLVFGANSIIDQSYTIHDLQINDDNYHIDAVNRPATLTITGRLLVNIPQSVGTLTGVSVLGPLSISPDSTSNLRVQLTGTNQEFSSTGAGALYINATLIDPPTGYPTDPSGVGGILKTGSGMIVFAGDNTYTGITHVQAGTLVAASSAAFGSTVRNTIVDSGASVGLAGGSVTDALQITGAGVGGRGALVGMDDPLINFGGHVGGGGSWIGGISLIGDATIGANTGVDPVDVDINGINGSGNLTKVGSGDLSLFVADSYTGNTLITQGSITIFDNDALSPGFSTTVSSGASLQLNNGLTVNETLFLNGDGRYFDSVGRPQGALRLFTAGYSTWLGSITIVTDSTVGADTDGHLLLSGALLGSGALTKVNLGNVRIARSNANYTGNTNVDNGTLEIAAQKALGTGTITVNSTLGTAAAAGTLQMEGTYSIQNPLVLNGVGFNTTGAIHVVNPLVGGTSTLTLAGGFKLNTSSSLNIDAGNTLSVPGVISDTSASPPPTMEKTGDGTLILSGNNTYSGATVLRGGTTILRSNKALGAPGGAGTSVTTGAILRLENGVTITNEPLNITGSSTTPTLTTLQAASGADTWAGTVNIISNSSSVAIDVVGGASLNLNGLLSGDSILHKVGSGELQLSGTTSNTNTGTIRVEAGTLSLKKTPGVGATNGNIVVGDSVGGAGADVLILKAANQIPDNLSVTVNSSGLFNLNNFNETLGGTVALTLVNGQVKTGTGVLTLNGNVANYGTPNTSVISGNVSVGTTTRSFTFQPSPQITLSSNAYTAQYGQNVTLTFNAVADTGVAVTGQVTFFYDGIQIGAAQTLSGGAASVSTAIIPGGTHTITAFYTGSSYYSPSTSTLTPTIQIVNAPATAFLSSSASTATPGQSITYTYSASGGAGAVAPTGTVTFYDGITQIGSPQTLSANGTASITTSFVGLSQIGTHAITAHYSGDTYYSASTTTLSPGQIIGYTPRMQLYSNADAIGGGRNVTFTFIASGDVGQPPATGTVTFFMDGDQIGTTQTLNAESTATVTINHIGFGPHTITAQYSGDSFYIPALATMPEQQYSHTPIVYQLIASSDPDLSSDLGASPPVYNPVTFIFKANTDPNDPPPTGFVDFFSNGIFIGSGTLTGGVATYTTDPGANPTLFPVGGYTITATYDPDNTSFHNGYGTHTETLQPGLNIIDYQTKVRLTSRTNTSLVGNSVTFDFNASSGTTFGTGVVQFFADGQAISGVIGLDPGGHAQVSVSFLSVGPHVITANYSGDANFTGGTYTLAPNQIVVAPYNAVLTSSADPSLFGTDVTFTYQAADATGAPDATGTVTFYDGTNVIGVETLPANGNGLVTLTVHTLSIGSHTISAIYSGDNNYQTNKTTLDDVQIIGTPPFIQISSSTNASQEGNLVTFTITITGGQSTALAAGRVDLFVNGFPLVFDLPVKNGVAVFTTTASDLPSGNYTIRAEYTGDQNYPAEIATMTQSQVVISPPLEQLSSSANPAITGSSVTYTYQVTASNDSEPTPTGTVNFYLDGSTTPFATRTLSGSGIASASLTINAAGNHVITAVYSGDDVYETQTQFLNMVVVAALPPLPPPTVLPRYTPLSTVNGTISGAGGLTADGPGVLYLNTVNTYTGPTTITGAVVGATGTVVLGINGALPNTPLILGDGGILDLNGKTDTVASLSGTGTLNLDGGSLTTGTNNGSTTFSGTITGSGSLTKVGTGSLTLSGNSPSDTGTTFINAGTVFVDGNESSASVVIRNGGTLGGGGQVGAVTVQAGGRLSPGHSPGLITVGNTTLSAGSIFIEEVNGATTPGTDYDQLKVNGNINLGGATLSLRVGYTPTIGDTYTIVSATGTVSGTFAGLADMATLTINGRVFQIHYTSTAVMLTMVGFAANATLTSNRNPASPNESVTFTATYTPVVGSDPTPTGTVTFFDGATQIGSPVTLNGSGVAQITTMFTTVGPHTIRAVYASTNGYEPMTTTLNETVNISTTTTLQALNSPSVFTSAVSFIASVTGSVGTATGSITFVDANTGAVLGVVALDATGRAELTTSAIPVGTNTIEAIYSGDTNYRTSSGTATQVVRTLERYAVGSGEGAPSSVNVYDPRDNALLATINPFDGYLGGIKVAVGDVNGDGIADIIIGAGPGAPGGHIKVYDGSTFAEIASFFAYPGFAGGVSVAAGDVNGDGRADIVVGTTDNNDHVEVFSGADMSTLMSFFAFGPNNPVGVTVGAGDVNGDGLADVIVGSAGFAGHVEVFAGMSGQLLQSFFAYGPGYLGGVNVAAGDVNGDGIADVITGATSAAPHVKVFDGATQAELASFIAYPGGDVGVRVGAVDSDGDGLADILTGAAGAAPHVKIFNGQTLSLMESFLSETPGQPNSNFGIYVGGGTD